MNELLWLVYSAGIGALLCGAGWAAERALAARQAPQRWAWAGAMLGALLLPLGAWLLARLGWAAAPTPPLRVTAAELPALAEPMGALLQPAADAGPALGPWLLGGWLLGSGGLLLFLALSYARLARRSRGWAAARLDGQHVLVSRETGPAVVGWLQPRIVLPAWALELDAAARALVLRHEAEHLRARDPWLLLGGWAALLAMPWNPALWWHFARLRAAIELDCDARVLRAGADVRSYGSLLLDVGRRGAASPLSLAALSHPAPLLERRIRQMTTPRRHPLLAATAYAALAAALVLAACEAPQPQAPSADGAPTAALDARPIAEVHGYEATATNGEELMVMLRNDVPPEYRDRRAKTEIGLVIDAQGQPRDVRIVKGSGVDALDRLALRLVNAARFPQPPEPILLTLPVDFWPRTPDGSIAPGVRTGAEELVVYEAPRDQPAPRTAQARQPTQELTVEQTGVRPEIRNLREVQQALEQLYPRQYADAGIAGQATVKFLIDTTGAVPPGSVTVLDATNDAFGQAAAAAVRTFQFKPIEYRGKVVRAWATMPITFQPPRPR